MVSAVRLVRLDNVACGSAFERCRGTCFFWLAGITCGASRDSKNLQPATPTVVSCFIVQTIEAHYKKSIPNLFALVYLNE